jgi:hypothetical protein
MLRRVETRLQLALGLDTKEVPKDGGALRVLALRLGYVDTAEGDAAHALLTDLDRAALETRASAMAGKRLGLTAARLCTGF